MTLTLFNSKSRSTFLSTRTILTRNWSVDTKCKSRDDVCTRMGLTSPNRTINQIWADTIPIEQLLFKRRPRFTSSKILFDPFSRTDRKKISEQSESISSNQPTFQKSFLKIVESLLAGALCDNSRNNFFKVLMKCSKKIFVEWKKNRSVWISTRTPPQHKKYFARSNVGADRSPQDR